jgi:hypothetical protein
MADVFQLATENYMSYKCSLGGLSKFFWVVYATQVSKKERGRDTVHLRCPRKKAEEYTWWLQLCYGILFFIFKINR